jgi:hypothetical protein
MFAATIEWSMSQGYSEIVTGTDVRFERILKRADCPYAVSANPGGPATLLPWRDCFPPSTTVSGACGPRPISRVYSRTSARPDGIAEMVQLRSHPRLVRKLQDALGDELCIALDDVSVVEVMLNPNGRLFIQHLRQLFAGRKGDGEEETEADFVEDRLS